MLRFIFGKSGSGKTTRIYNKIVELLNDGNDKIIIIVPDQSSFETEKAFLDLLGAKKSKKVLVFGFSRLCRYVFEHTGNYSKNIIDNGTRAVFMSVAIEQLTEKLKLLQSKSNKSLVDVMLNTIGELKKNSITSDMLRAGAELISDTTLMSKLNETALIYDTFDALVSQSYIDPLDDLTRLYNILQKNNIFDGYTIFYDGFSGFTLQQQKVIRILMSQAKDTYMTLTLDPLSDGNEDVFATSHRTYKIIKNFAKKDYIEIKPPINLENTLRFKSSELKCLENGLFRNDCEIQTEAPNDIMLYRANDSYSECEFVAQQIKNLVINKGYLYSDISIISHETTQYNGILNEILEKYDIPYFMDVKSDIEVKPVIRLIIALFRVILHNFERDDVLSMLKSGLTLNTTDEISIFENYVFVWNINRSGLKNEFSNNPRGFADSFTKNDETALSIAENVRKSIVLPLLSFKENTVNKTGREISELLYNLLTELGVQDALNNIYKKYENTNEKTIGSEQIKIWNLFTDMLDKMVAVTSDSYISLQRYYELLSLQISEVQLSTIPQTIDSVIVTTAQRVRLSKQKATFLIGCIDGNFPASPHSTGIFSAFELKLLALSDIAIGEDFSDFVNLEKFMTYCCMTSASEKLYISYPIVDAKDKTNNPSVIYTEVIRLFPNISEMSAYDFPPEIFSMYAKKPAFEALSKSLANSDKGLNGLIEYFESDEKYKEKLKAIQRAKDSSPFEIRDSKNAERLFGTNLKISASQIEKFNLCRFSYFCNYGLNIRERRKAEINPMEYGTLVHYILEKFFTVYNKEQYSSMSSSDIKIFVNDTLADYTNTYFGGEESKTKSFMYKLEVLKSNVCLLLNHIASEMKQSDFEVYDCELKIGSDIPQYTIKLPDNHNIAIYGSVDRVDVMEKNGVKYIRIIDYKTGQKKFKLSDILYGLNLQMLLYLYSIKSNGTQRYGDVVPSGILYMPATVPVITAGVKADEISLKEKMEKDLTMNGLLLNDIEVIRGMDKTDCGKYIPVKVKLDTPVSARSLVTVEEFGKIFKKIDIITASMGKALYSGKIHASPVKGAHDACEYCPYDCVCAYHKSSPVTSFDTDNEEVIRQITEEINREGDK